MTEAQKVRQLILELLNISGGLSMSTEKLVTEVRLAGFDHRQVEAELETLSALGYVLRLPPSPFGVRWKILTAANNPSLTSSLTIVSITAIRWDGASIKSPLWTR